MVKHSCQRGAALLVVLIIQFLLVLSLLSTGSEIILASRLQNLQQERAKIEAAAQNFLEQSDQDLVAWIVPFVQTEACTPEQCIPIRLLPQLPAMMPKSWWDDPLTESIFAKKSTDPFLSAKMVLECLQSEFNEKNQWLSGYFRVTVRVLSHHTDLVTVLHSTVRIKKTNHLFQVSRLSWHGW